jgi:hypothetical protein
MAKRPRVIDRHMVRDEIEHEAETTRTKFGACLPQRVWSAEMRSNCIIPHTVGRAKIVFWAVVRQHPVEFGLQIGVRV